jgi:uncharacterized protein YcbK (DUF882 family)
MSRHSDDPVCSVRRRLLKGLGGLSLGLGCAARAHAVAAGECRLAFHHTHTDEQLSIVYRRDGRYLAPALERIDWLLRDFRTGEMRRMDPRLLDILHALSRSCDGDTFEVVSAYRSPATNAMLRQSGDGVARRSLHLDGRAIDVRLTGFDTARLRDAALTLGRGGVGYYPSSNFVHLDTGRVRTWGPSSA